MNRPRAILGLDAAWTPHGSSGVALAAETERGVWRTVAVHGSYEDFIAAAGIDPPESIEMLPKAMVEAGSVLAPATTLSVIVVDMPLSKLPITGRRTADNLISKAFGAAGCSTHTPSNERAGSIAAALRDGFRAVGFPLTTDRIVLPGLYETYPHPALLHLMNVRKRVPYKVSKASKLWPGVAAGDRWNVAVQKLQEIASRLDTFVGGAEFNWPIKPVSMSSLKVLEDQIDALVCAWVGTLIVEGNVTSFGDSDAAVWLPSALKNFQTRSIV